MGIKLVLKIYENKFVELLIKVLHLHVFMYKSNRKRNVLAIINQSTEQKEERKRPLLTVQSKFILLISSNILRVQYSNFKGGISRVLISKLF